MSMHGLRHACSLAVRNRVVLLWIVAVPAVGVHGCWWWWFRVLSSAKYFMPPTMMGVHTIGTHHAEECVMLLMNSFAR